MQPYTIADRARSHVLHRYKLAGILGTVGSVGQQLWQNPVTRGHLTRTAIGAGVGAVTGAIAGGEDNRLGGALKGGLAGAAIGGLGSVANRAYQQNPGMLQQANLAVFGSAGAPKLSMLGKQAGMLGTALTYGAKALQNPGVRNAASHAVVGTAMGAGMGALAAPSGQRMSGALQGGVQGGLTAGAESALGHVMGGGAPHLPAPGAPPVPMPGAP